MDTLSFHFWDWGFESSSIFVAIYFLSYYNFDRLRYVSIYVRLCTTNPSSLIKNQNLIFLIKTLWNLKQRTVKPRKLIQHFFFFLPSHQSLSNPLFHIYFIISTTPQPHLLKNINKHKNIIIFFFRVLSIFGFFSIFLLIKTLPMAFALFFEVKV